MGNDWNIKLYAFTIDCADPQALAGFYASLLGWEMPFSDGEYAVIAPPGVSQGAYPGITFQHNPVYRPPVWPSEPEAQQQMAHIDIAVDDLERAAAHATFLGATVAGTRYSEHWRVMLDPAGHPFCLCLLPHVFGIEEP